MKQLSGVDATFLYMETDSVFGHVSSLSIYERPDDDYEPLAAWREQIEKRLHLLEPFTRRLRNVPFKLDHPYWVADPAFDLDFHVRHTAVAPPGTDEQASALVSRIIGRPLDRSRPLWESYVIEGLAGNRFGILTKVHHAAVDGALGAELLTMMLDADPAGDDVSEAPAVATEPIPTDGEMLATAALNLARKPGRMLVLTARTARAMGETTNNPLLAAAGRQLREQLRGPLGNLLNARRERPEEPDEVAEGPLPANAPATPFNRSITPHRSFAYRSVSLAAVKGVKNALGATLNDVVMAVCAGGLRTYLEGRDALPDDPLVAMVPVSIRTGEEADRWTNRVSGIIAALPTNEPDPLERVRKVNAAMMAAKGLHDALPAEALTQFADFPPPAVFTRASRMATRFQIGNRFGSPINLVISNVPGPREPLYAAGAKLLHYIPVSTIAEGQGLNITVQSYLDTLDIGLVGCAELVPDIWDLVDAIVADLEALADFVGYEGVVRMPGPADAAPEKAPAKKRAPAAKTRAPKKTAGKKRASTKAAAKKGTARKRTAAKKPVKKAAATRKRS